LGIATSEDAVTLATHQVLATHALRDNLMAVLFPRGEGLPSELLQSRVKLKLQSLVLGIERALLSSDVTRSLSWDILSDAGLLREPELIDFALSRIAEDRLQDSVQSASSASILGQLPAKLLSHENDRLSEMARTLLYAEQISASDESQLFHRLDSELLHLLCWRVVAALLELRAADNEILTAAAHALLANHQAESNPAAMARKLVFFLGHEFRAELNDPLQSGLHLFVASLDQDYALGNDFLLRLIGGDYVAPLLLLLKGQSLAATEAAAILSALRANVAGKDSVDDWHTLYEALDPVEARAAVAAWKLDRP
jgi:hypothetical protein